MVLSKQNDAVRTFVLNKVSTLQLSHSLLGLRVSIKRIQYQNGACIGSKILENHKISVSVYIHPAILDVFMIFVPLAGSTVGPESI